MDGVRDATRGGNRKKKKRKNGRWKRGENVKGVIPMKRLMHAADLVRVTQYTAIMGCQWK